MVFLTALNFQFDEVFMLKVGHKDVQTAFEGYFRLYKVETLSVEDGFEEGQKKEPPPTVSRNPRL